MLLAGAATAAAGIYEQAICLNPDSSQAPTDGWVASYPATGASTTGYETLAADSCAPSVSGSPYPETPMTVKAGGGGTTPLAAEWTYTAPASTTIVGGQVVTYDNGDLSPGAAGQAWISVGQDTGKGAGTVIACVYSTGCTGPAPAFAPLSATDGKLTTVPIPAVASASQMFVYATNCGLSGCNGTGEVDLYSAVLELQTTTPPQGSNFQGTLLTPNAHGTATLSFSAADPGGPGVASVSLLIDGTAAYRTHVANGTPDRCEPVTTDPSTGLPIYEYRVPCAASANISTQVATGALADGPHVLKIEITDAAGNTATVYNQPITTENNSTPSSTATEKPGASGVTGSTGAAGGTTGAAGGTTGAAGGTAAGSSSGGGASPPVVVVPPPDVTVTAGKSPPLPHYSLTLSTDSQKLVETKPIRRLFSHSALSLSGTVLGSTGVGLGGAPVKVVATAPGGGRPVVVANARSDGTGAFTITVPRGDTRTLQLVASAGTVTMHEVVTPNLSVKLHQVDKRAIRITGTVGIAQGAARPQLELEILNKKTWQLLGQTITVDRNGTFTDTYTAAPGAIPGHYRVRLVLLGTPAWTPVVSEPRTVTL